MKLPPNPKEMWDYIDFLPVEERNNVVSLGESISPLLEAKNLEKQLGLDNLYIKDYARNTTGSFKDRPNSVGISKAKEFGIDTIVIASSGNASSSAAAYAAKGNMRCIVFVPESTPKEKLVQARVYQAEVFKVKGHYSNAFRLAMEATSKYGWYNVTTTYLNPYTVEGNKVVAYELFEQIGVPDFIFVPIGAGPLLYGTLKGFKELKMMGKIEKYPKMVGVQAARCSPIVEAFEKNQREVKGWTKEIPTIASGINDPLIGYENDGSLTLEAIYQSKGYGVKLQEEAILESIHSLAKEEGIFAEPAGAVGLGGVKQLVEKGVIKPADKVVVLVTGHGLKNIAILAQEELKLISQLTDLNNNLTIKKEE